jgi:hypothetical protein
MELGKMFISYAFEAYRLVYQNLKKRMICFYV